MHAARLPALTLIAAVALGCGARPPASHAPRATPQRRAEPTPTDGPLHTALDDGVGPAETELPPLRSKALPDPFGAVYGALEERRLGHLAQARALLEAAELEIGPPSTDGEIARTRGGLAGIGFTTRGITGTVFFDASTGEPAGIVSSDYFVADTSESPHAESPGLFVGSDRTRRIIYDARNRAVLAGGPRVLQTADGATAYVSSDDRCSWAQWNLRTGRLVGELERAGEANSYCPAFAVLADDGKALLGAAWWDLDTRTIHRTSRGWALFSGASPALSPDQTWVAFVTYTSGPDTEPALPSALVTLVNRRTGSEHTSASLGTLTNSEPLEFAESPLRIIVSDYSQRVLDVPSLRLLARSNLTGPQDPAVAALLAPTRQPDVAVGPPSADETAPLRALLDRATCTRGGFIVPLDLCSP